MDNQKENTIQQIIQKEWAMFDQVNGMGGRALCQDDWKTFYVMRYSQHNALGDKTLQSYLGDLIEAQHENRNLITEKYGYMMEKTDPLYYMEILKDRLPEIGIKKMDLIQKILEMLEKQYQAFEQQYPRFCAQGRPKDAMGTVAATVMIYNLGELKTYSEQTLKLYLQDLFQTPDFVQSIQDQTAKFYGFESLQEAEKRLSTQGR